MKVLIIEDDKDLASLLKISLKKEMLTVDLAENAEKGLFLFGTNVYDLLIVDYNLPKKNGRDLVKEIRSQNQDVKIIILTVENSQNIKKELFDLGIDDFISKPFVYEEFLSRVKAVLRRPSVAQKPTYHLDDLSVDVEKHIVKRGKKSIYLTFKEITILEFFFKNINKIIPRTVLLENIWDFNADPFSNTVESHILKLRKKINPSGLKKELIHTIKGRGYKLGLKKW